MGSSIGRVLFMVIGGFAVVAISFFATMQILDYWLAPQDPNANVIHVVDATYGLACKDFASPSGRPNLVKIGNVTAALTQRLRQSQDDLLVRRRRGAARRPGQRLQQGLCRQLALRQRPEGASVLSDAGSERPIGSAQLSGAVSTGARSYLRAGRTIGAHEGPSVASVTMRCYDWRRKAQGDE